MDKESVIRSILEAFANSEFPGDGFLQGSFDGCEPAEEIEPFLGQHDWQKVDSQILDSHSAALNFLSEAGLRFFLPAYLIADLRDQLRVADPLFVLIHGFSDTEVDRPTKFRTFKLKTGKSGFVNPRRYGAMTFYDYAKMRLSIFSREEANAIVAYLRHHLESQEPRSGEIQAALDAFWIARAANAPTTDQLRQHLIEEQEYLAAITSEFESDKPK